MGAMSVSDADAGMHRRLATYLPPQTRVDLSSRDFAGAADALTWPQMQEMVRSGLIEIQPHSKTHANLSRAPGG